MTGPLPPSRYPEERRMATVLFADVQGFTALAEQLDYEMVSDLIKGIWVRLDAIVDSFGGYIDKHVGDGVMAVWGAPFAGDSDAEQAVSAGLVMQSSLNEFVDASPVPGANRLRLRVGINTGPVFAGYVGTRNEYTMIGDTVNVANRLEQASEPGTVVIGESTYRLVRGVFRVKRLTPLSVKGKTEPVDAFLVEGLLSASGRVRYGSLDSMVTVMVAREAEMARLEAFYQQAMNGIHPVMALVMGETGVGKSRLLMEVISKIEMGDPSFTLLSSRALAQASRVPFYLWKSLWHNRFGLRESDPPEVTRETLMREVQKLWGNRLGPVSAVEAAHLIGSLVGVEWPGSPYLAAADAPEARLHRAFELTRMLMERICANRRTVLLFDDLQWADRGSLDLLSYLLQPAECPLPIFVLAGARPDFTRQQPRWANIAQTVLINPLPVNVETVTAAYPDLHWLPQPVLSELATRADGNPYFLEEMAKGLVKGGLKEGECSTEELLARLRSQMPESLRATLQARLDALPREARAVALLASVVGRVFWVGAVVAAARATTSTGTGPLMVMPTPVIDRIVQDGLRRLVLAELAFPRANTRYSSDQEYIFKNSLLRDVAYGLIPNKYVKQYHLAVAHWLSARNDADFKVMAAEHFEQAGALVEASRQYEQAAGSAQLRGATSEAKDLWSRVITMHEKAEAQE